MNPVQEDPLFEPLITSQYVPSESEVLKVVDQLLSALLIATNPADPLPNAICELWGDTQSLIALEPTVFLKPTIPVKAYQRCWQIQPLMPPVPEHVPAPPLGAPPSNVEMLKLDNTVGVPYE